MCALQEAQIEMFASRYIALTIAHKSGASMSDVPLKIVKEEGLMWTESAAWCSSLAWFPAQKSQIVLF